MIPGAPRQFDEGDRLPQTLPGLLARAASRGLGGWSFHSGRDVVALPVAELYERALRLASEMGRAGVGIGTQVGIVGLNCPDWACWAWATWLSGAALVPLPAPLLVGASFASQVTSLLDATRCSIVVGDRRYLDQLAPGHFERWDWSAPVPPTRNVVRGERRTLSPSELAVVLCTSGSTADPKAVRMSHARAVEWAVHNVVHPSDGSVPSMVTWFPFYHIAGLGILFELVSPVDQHVIGMRRFLADPASWLRLVGETRAAYAVSPSSVWSDVLDRVARDPAGIDLSHLERVAFNAEMTDPDVLDRMGEVCRPLGLRPGAIAVHYASSEAGMISRTPLDTDPRVESIDLGELVRSGRAVEAMPGAPSKRVVSCGQPYAGAEICVGHPDHPLPERREGEVWVRGPGVTEGYLNASVEGRLVEGWLRLGDLAYLADGELWVTGRADEVVTLHGEKYHPEDIEWAISSAVGVGPGACAAFSPRDGRAGSFVVVVGVDSPRSGLADEVSTAVSSAIGIAPSEVFIVAAGTIPTTPNGKLQRSKLRELHSAGSLGSSSG